MGSLQVRMPWISFGPAGFNGASQLTTATIGGGLDTTAHSRKPSSRSMRAARSFESRSLVAHAAVFAQVLACFAEGRFPAPIHARR